MKAFLPLLCLAVFSVSPALTWETSIFKQKEESEPALALEIKNEDKFQEGQNEPNKQEAFNTEERPEPLLQEHPGSSNLQEKPGNLNQDGRQGFSNQLESSQGKPGQTNQRENAESSSQQRKMRFFYNQKERKTTHNPLKGDVIEIQKDKTNDKKPSGNTKCLSIYKPVCGSDKKTYGNICLLNEAKRLSHGKLNLKHEGIC